MNVFYIFAALSWLSHHSYTFGDSSACLPSHLQLHAWKHRQEKGRWCWTPEPCSAWGLCPNPRAAWRGGETHGR